MTRQVFISYAHEDRNRALELSGHLEKLEIACFIDRDRISPGSRISGSVEAGIRASSHFIVLLSPHAVASDWVPEELKLAVKLRLIILPIRLAFDGELPLRMNVLLGDTLYSYWKTDQAIASLEQEITKFLDIERKPYSFGDTVMRANLPFLNRDEVREALEDLVHPEGRPILIVDGARGVGKSYIAELVQHVAQGKTFGAIVPIREGLLELQHLTNEIIDKVKFEPSLPASPGSLERLAIQYLAEMVKAFKGTGIRWVLIFDGFKTGSASDELLALGKRIVTELTHFRHVDTMRLLLIDSPELEQQASKSIYANKVYLEFAHIQKDHAHEYMKARLPESLWDMAMTAVDRFWTAFYGEQPPKLRDFSNSLLLWTSKQLRTRN